MHASHVRHADLAAALLDWSQALGKLVIAIDGAGASGKSCLARGLAASGSALQVVPVDAFYRPSRERYTGPPATRPVAADFDLLRLRREVLEPLRAGGVGAYRSYDWERDALCAERTPVTGPLVVVEGVYSSSSALAAFFDLSFWVECPRELRLARGLARDGEAARPRWEQDWMPGEDRYIDLERPRDKADIVCDGTRMAPSDPLVFLTPPGDRARPLLERLTPDAT